MDNHRRPRKPRAPSLPPVLISEAMTAPPDEDNEFLQLLGTSEEGYRTTIYKYTDWSGTLKNLIHQCYGVPTVEDVARKFGGGRFHCLITKPDGIRITGTLRIDDNYGGNGFSRSPEVENDSGSSAFKNLSEAIDLMDKMASILERNRPPVQSIPEQMSGIMGNMMQATGKVMEQAVQTQSRLVLETQKEVSNMRKEFSDQLAEIENNADYEEIDPIDENEGGELLAAESEHMNENGIDMNQVIVSAAIETMEPLIQKYLGDILGAKPTDFIIGAIKQHKTYKDLLKYPGALEQVKIWVSESIGEEKAEKVFSVIGL